VIPILRKQPGFLGLLSFLPESATYEMFLVSLWTEKREAERYMRTAYPGAAEFVNPFLATPITVKQYAVETSICPSFLEAFAA